MRSLRFALSFLCLVAGWQDVAAGVIGKDKRQPISAYAASVKKSEADVRKEFAASGRIMCPFNEASAFLVHQGDVILTARHVIFPERSMVRYAGRPALGNCGFEVTDGKTSQWYRIDVKAIIYPDDRQRSFTDRFDWIAMKLAEPIPGVKPYKLPVRPAAVKDKVTVVSIRQDGFPFEDWNERIVSECQVRKTWAIDGISGSGLETDCDLTMKSSGSPVLRRTDDGWDVVGIASSGTADCPKFRSKRCANWAVGLTDAVADAVRKLAAMPSGATKY